MYLCFLSYVLNLLKLIHEADHSHGRYITLFTHVVRRHFSYKTNKTGVINDPLGQTHSHASSEHCFVLFVFVDLKSGDGRTDEWTTCAKILGWPIGSIMSNFSPISSLFFIHMHGRSNHNDWD